MSKRYRISEKELEIVQHFVDTIPYTNVDYIEISKGSRFEVDIPEANIFLGSKRFTNLDSYFFEWLETKEKDFKPNYFVIALLHEVGHIITQDKELLSARDTLDKIHGFLFDYGTITEKEYNFSYFDFPAEIQATEWAIDYYKHNLKDCENLALQLGV